ncbi:hypothetical protein PCANB_000140 [Pneumocystis canis]|nr:hypothetical protein PCANB_000140 [Pneumocystis canis]
MTEGNEQETYVGNNSYIRQNKYKTFDFWTVKNVSGRFLVKLRWWNEVNHNGENRWAFESANFQNKQNSIDSNLFWLILYLVPVIWLIFGIVAILKFNFIWLNVVIIAFSLSSINALAFTRDEECNKDQKNKWTENIPGKFLDSDYSFNLFNMIARNIYKFF